MTHADTAEQLGVEYFADPYSVHARLRDRRPVAPVIMPGGMPAWLVTGYALGRAALSDPRLLKLPGAGSRNRAPCCPPSTTTCSTATRPIITGCERW
jgi:cytochrome P450